MERLSDFRFIIRNSCNAVIGFSFSQQSSFFVIVFDYAENVHGETSPRVIFLKDLQLDIQVAVSKQ
jgi:hypothetical protein